MCQIKFISIKSIICLACIFIYSTNCVRFVCKLHNKDHLPSEHKLAKLPTKVTTADFAVFPPALMTVN